MTIKVNIKNGVKDVNNGGLNFHSTCLDYITLSVALPNQALKTEAKIKTRKLFAMELLNIKLTQNGLYTKTPGKRQQY